MNENEEKSIKTFGFFISVVFGLSLIIYILPFVLGILSNILRIDLFSVEFRNFNWPQTIVFLIITTTIILSGYGFLKLKKWGPILFIPSFIVNILAKASFLLNGLKSICPLSVLGILISFIGDIIFIIYFIKIFSQVKKIFAR